jgi:hypothetical protein
VRLPSPISYFKGWRHSHGFGIHSPFAYRFVTEVLAQPLPYYGYTDISADRRIRLIFRVIAYFSPGHVLILSSQPRLLKMAVHRAYSQAIITESAASKPDFVIADAMDAPAAGMKRFASEGTNMIVLNATCETRPELAEAMHQGMIFDNGRGTLVVIPAPGLPRQDFRVKF